MTEQLTDWRAAQGVLKPYLPDLPSETIIRRSRDGVCLYCGQSWCAGCKEIVREPVKAMRSDEV